MKAKHIPLLCFLPLLASVALSTGLPNPKEFKKGVVYGKILDSNSKPVPDATVAVRDPAGKVLAWTKTDAQGQYAVAIDPKVALNLYSRNHGLLVQCINDATDVVMAPARAVAGVVTSPGETAKSTIESVASGTPAPITAQAVGAALPARSDVAGAAARGAVGDDPAKAQAVGKGGTRIMVSANGFKDADVTPHASWMEGPAKDTGLQAWIETIKMAPTSGAGKSDVVPEVASLSAATVTPTLAPPGSQVTVSVKMSPVPAAGHQVRVFAREGKAGEVAELLPGKDAGVYSGTLTLEKKLGAGDTTVCIGALRSAPVEVHLRSGKTDPLPLFVHRLGDMEPGKDYQYDPLIMASQNRADVKLTILPAKPGG